MKGIIFNLFEGFIVESFGQDSYDEIYESANLQTKEPFVGPGTYPDADLMSLVKKACELHKLPPNDTVRSFGKYCFGGLAAKYPQFVTPFKNPKDFLLSVESVIHMEVRKLYHDAITPSFTYRNPSANRLIIEYRSQRKLCMLMEGLIEGTGDYYKAPIIQKQTLCTHKGAKHCEFDLTFA